MSLIFLAKGNARMGMNRVDKDGKITESILPKFETAPDGGCIAIGELDSDSMEQNGAADIFGDYDAAGYLAKVLELLKPSRQINIPDFRDILRASQADHDRDYFCEHCRDFGHRCLNCIVTQWREELEDEP